jgi:hypothetical protein
MVVEPDFMELFFKEDLRLNQVVATWGISRLLLLSKGTR